MSTANNVTKLFLYGTKGQKIVVGDGPDQVIIEIAKHTAKSCTLNFYAPKHISVDRFQRRFEPEGR